MAIRPRTTCNVLDLCSGIGMLGVGLHAGLECLGVESRTVCYVEREAYCAAALVARMEDAALDRAPVWDDLKTFDGRPWRGIVDCVAAGYPCQPFSAAGKRLGASDPRHLWPDIARIVAEIRPGLVFFENVAGHVTLGCREVRSELQGLGYRVAAGLFSASEVGASHRRERLFILGVADGDGARREAAVRREGINERSELEQGRNGLADTDRLGGLHAKTSQRNGAATTTAAPGAGLFAPGPGDRRRWGRIIGRRPDYAPAVEPELLRLADGLADRLDRLRAAGNGVVPLQAALAFVTLAACVGE